MACGKAEHASPVIENVRNEDTPKVPRQGENN